MYLLLADRARGVVASSLQRINGAAGGEFRDSGEAGGTGGERDESRCIVRATPLGRILRRADPDRGRAGL